MGRCVAIMQPYFVPYLGYFRLFSQSDLFVIYDCVQFPRRGYVHRNQVPDGQGNARWLTLPLAKCDQKTPINELVWREGEKAVFVEQLRNLQRGWNIVSEQPHHARWLETLCDMQGSVVDYLQRTLAFTCNILDIHCDVIRSSALQIPSSIKGQDRIIAICKAMDANRYVNAPGGRELYEPEVFAAQGIELNFLEPYRGSHWSVAYRLLTETSAQLQTEL